MVMEQNPEDSMHDVFWKVLVARFTDDKTGEMLLDNHDLSKILASVSNFEELVQEIVRVETENLNFS